MAVLVRIKLNWAATKSCKRHLFVTVHSIIFYAALIWASYLRYKTNPALLIEELRGEWDCNYARRRGLCLQKQLRRFRGSFQQICWLKRGFRFSGAKGALRRPRKIPYRGGHKDGQPHEDRAMDEGFNTENQIMGGEETGRQTTGALGNTAYLYL